MKIEDIVNEAQIIKWRRHIHQHPELSFQESQTAAYIKATLESMEHVDVEELDQYAIIATIHGGIKGKTIALRADIDALPVHEETEVSYKSIHSGIMHACGHDAHVAMLLGAADGLSKIADQLQGTVKLIFQPAEELPPGGAKHIVDAGILNDVDYIFGLHVVPNLPVGMIGSAVGSISSSSDTFKVIIQGKGSHGSTPELSIDPITIGAELIGALNTIVSRNIPASERAVISFGEFTSGCVANVIPDKATIQGTVRSFSPIIRKTLKDRIYEITKHTIAAFSASYQMEWVDGYDSVVNHEEAVNVVKEAANKVVGANKYFVMPAMMGSEDFSEYTNVCPGAFFILGVGEEKDGFGYMNHHPKFNVDESALKYGTMMHIQIILDLLR